MTEARPAFDSQVHLALALEAGQMGTWWWDLDAGVVTLDAMMERLYGLEPGSFDGMFDTLVTMLHPDDAAGVLASVEKAIADPDPFDLEYRVIWPDGTVRWIHGRGTVTVDDTGHVTGTIGCAVDITPRKLLGLETEQRAAEAERAVARERRERERLQFIDAVVDSAHNASDHRELMYNVCRTAVPHLGDWCSLHFIPHGAKEPETEVAHSDPDKVAWAKELRERFPFNPGASTGVAAVMQTGQTEFVRHVGPAEIERAVAESAHLADPDEVLAIAEALELTSVITVPLRTKRGVIGAMQFVSAESRRPYDDDDVVLCRTIANRVGDLLESAWATDQHRLIASTLQSALLPPRLPDVTDFSLAVRYWAAGAATDVGGDFYDVFAVDDGTWALVIGDVCGTGPDAAAVTAIARHTIRAAATHGVSHEEVLEWVNDALHAGNRDLFCTAVYSTLEHVDDDSWRFQCVAGGHPLPIVVHPDGTAGTVGQPGTLLGVFPEIEVTRTEVMLASGDTVILHTDGVTDVRPPHDIDPDELLAMAADAADVYGDADAVANRLGLAIHRLLPIPDRHDDVALAVVRLGRLDRDL